MMKIRFLLVSKTTESYIQAGIEGYSKRIKKYASFEIVELNTPKMSTKLSHSEIKKKEAALIQKHIQPSEYLILLDDKGKSFDSIGFSQRLERWKDTMNKPLVFLVGGAYGFHSEIYERADFKVSLSPMTFSHQIIRIIFLEQLYRAFSILNNEPYHHA